MKKKYADESLGFDKELLLSKLDAESLQKLSVCEILDEIDSTNQYLLSRAYDEVLLPRACFANRQTVGRGRRGRSWNSESQSNIYMSLSCKLTVSLQEVSCIALAIGLAVSRVLNAREIDAAVKWPNDVLVKGKKIAGILIETKVKSAQQALMVIGVGLNVDMREYGENIAQPWTDVRQQLGDVDVSIRSELAGELLSELMRVVDEYMLYGFKKFKDEFAAQDLCYQQLLSVKTEGRILSGRGLGVDEQGRLCVEIEGQPCCFYAADVSIRVPACC